MSSIGPRYLEIPKFTVLEALGKKNSEWVKCPFCSDGYLKEWTDEREMQCNYCAEIVSIKHFLQNKNKQDVLNMIKEAKLSLSLLKIGVRKTDW